MTASAVARFFWELHGRRVLRTLGLYVIASWLVLQASEILFPAWGIPEVAIGYVFWAILIGLPVVAAFAWVFDVTPSGIRRTQASRGAGAVTPLRTFDYAVLAGFVLVLGLLIQGTASRVLATLDAVEAPSVEVTPGLRANSVAVLPFDNLSSDPEQEYFADGISEEILNRLSVFHDLTVIARTSSFAFKGSGYDVPRISELLGVEYLLQGSIRRDAQQLRISAQLVSRDGVQVWTRTFDREMGSVFALYDEIAEAVAASILPTITATPTADRIPDLAAYEEYLAGRAILASRTSADRALAHLNRAIELDPDFIEPYAERAVAHALLPIDDGYLQRAKLDIDRALALRSDHPRTLAVQALLLYIESPLETAATQEALLKRSLAMDPNQVDAWNWLYSALVEQGRDEEASIALTRAVLLDPLAPAPNVNLARRETINGDFVSAERRLLRLLDAPNPPPMAFTALTSLSVMTGHVDKGHKAYLRYMFADELWRDYPPDATGLTFTYTLLEIPDEAEYWRHKLEQAYPQVFVTLLRLLIVSLDRDAAPNAYLHARELVDINNLSLTGEGMWTRVFVGSLASLYDDHTTTIRLLEPLFENTAFDRVQMRRATHALAWSYLETGQPDRANAILAPIESHDRAPVGREQAMEDIDPGTGYVSAGIAGRALTLRLLGDTEAALTLLEQAVDLGWRGRKTLTTDPRWSSLQDHPKYQAIVTRLDNIITPQRERVRKLEADGNIRARLDEAFGQPTPR